MADINKTNKIIKQAKGLKSEVKFTKIGAFEDLKILVVTDAALNKRDNRTKSVKGKFVFLSNKEETKVSPIMWKSKSISQVCRSAKAAETRSIVDGLDDAVYIARIVAEIYTTKRGENQIPVTLVTDSQSTLDSIFSTKQVDEKLMRPLIQWVKQCMDSNWLQEVRWCDTKLIPADMLTKAGLPIVRNVMEMMKTGRLWNLKERVK